MPVPTSGPMLNDTPLIACPKCQGQMWDNRTTKKNPKAPDFKCKNRSCDGAIWPEKEGPAKKNGTIPPTATPVVESGEKKPTMREAYKALTEWVISDIAPIYEKADIGIPPETIAACTQTLFIQACKAGKVE